MIIPSALACVKNIDRNGSVNLSKVYFIKNTGSDYNLLGKDALELLKEIVSQTGYQFEKEMPIKVHFGEKGNHTFIPAKCYDEIINYLKEKGVSPSYIETNVLYRGSRTTSEKHLQTAISHGFTQIPIIIADGEIGTDYDEIEINKEYLNTCKIGKGYGKYKQFIVTSHFKGHIVAGFGGSLKQLARFRFERGKAGAARWDIPCRRGRKLHLLWYLRRKMQLWRHLQR